MLRGMAKIVMVVALVAVAIEANILVQDFRYFHQVKQRRKAKAAAEA